MDFSKSDWLLNLFHRNAQKRNNRLNDEWKRTRNLLWCLHILWNWTYWNNWIRTLCACACACACACVLSCAEHCAVSILRCLLIHVLCAEYDFVLVKHFILCSFHFVWLPACLAGWLLVYVCAFECITAIRESERTQEYRSIWKTENEKDGASQRASERASGMGRRENKRERSTISKRHKLFFSEI